jgi:hypothetical protein
MKLSKTSFPVAMWQRSKPKAGGCRSDNLSVESSPRRVTTRPDPHLRWGLFWTQRGSRIPARATWILVVACMIVALGALSPAEGLGRPGQAGASTGYGPRFANLGETLYGYTGQTITEPAVGMAPTPDAGGYWLVGADGGIFAFGDAQFFGSTGSIHLNQPIAGMAPTPDGDGYWLVASDGGIFAFGDAQFFGSTGSIHLNRPIVGMASTPDGGGYWLVASDGGIFSFGDAQFYGSTGSIHLNRPIVGMATTFDGGGYSLVASDGGIFSFGDARFYGSTGGIHLNQPIVGMALTPDGRGYWLVASDGGIFSFGNAQFFGSKASAGTGVPIIGLQSSETGLGYSLIGQHGQIYPFGDAGVPTTADSVVSAIRGEISTSLDSDVTALVNQQAPGNPNGLWIGGDPAYWFSSSGPGLAAAAVAAATGDPTMRADAEQTFDTLIAEHEQPNGSFIAVSNPQSPDISTMFFVTNLGMALWALRPQMSPGEVATWTAAITAGANYLVKNGNLTWYTNGNIVIGNALVMALAYWATANPVYETYYQQALSFAISPPQYRWPGFGLIYTKMPSLPDGSDGAAYFAEAGGGTPGFDADYTQLQLDQLTRLYLVTSSPQVLRLVNLVVNQEWPLVDTATFLLNESGGTRHPQPDRYIPFTSAGLALSASAGGQSYLTPYLQRQAALVESTFYGYTTYWNPGGQNDFGLQAATFVLLGP